eukprot:11223365-Lingulodinium_polyedra.AAC.1
MKSISAASTSPLRWHENSPLRWRRQVPSTSIEPTPPRGMAGQPRPRFPKPPPKKKGAQRRGAGTRTEDWEQEQA